MNKILIIDLLNKIANEEEVPKKINYYGHIYIFNNEYKVYINQVTKSSLGHDYKLDKCLNDEVEIIEDNPKKIEELDNRHFDEINQVYCGKKELGEAVLVDKINELTKATNYLLERNDNNGI